MVDEHPLPKSSPPPPPLAPVPEEEESLAPQPEKKKKKEPKESHLLMKFGILLSRSSGRDKVAAFFQYASMFWKSQPYFAKDSGKVRECGFVCRFYVYLCVKGNNKMCYSKID